MRRENVSLVFVSMGIAGCTSTDVSGMGDFPERDFLLGIRYDMIAVAPEVTDLRFGRLREMDQDT